MSATELLDYFRPQVLMSDWETQGEVVLEDMAWLSWSFQDEAGLPWFGLLLIAPTAEGIHRVRVLMTTGASAELGLQP